MSALLAGRHSPGRGGASWGRGEELAQRRGADLHRSGSLSLIRQSGFQAGAVVGAWTGHLAGLDRVARAIGADPAASTEHLLATGYRRLGMGILQELRGAYVLALWDREAERGLVGTDLMGRCALFWRDTANGAVFAGELRDLLALLDSRPAPDELSVIHLLTRPGPPRGRTAFAGVHRLETGSCLELRPGGCEVVRHWRPRYETPLRGSRAELADALLDQTRGAVARSLEGSARAAVFLSGGIDSSISAALASELDVDLRGYSAVFPDHPEVDESDYLDSITEHTGVATRRFAVEPQGSMAASLEYLAEWEVPVPGAGYLLERPLAIAAAQDGMSIVLDGQGGDEVFGTTPYVAANDLIRGRLLKSIRTSQATPWTANVPTARARFALWRSAALNPWIPDRLFQAVRRARGREPLAPDWLTDAGLQTYRDTVDDEAWKRSADGPIWWRYMSDLLIHHASGVRCDYLRHRSASFGLEARPPLLDVDLALFALRIPPHMAMDPERDRPLIRDAMTGLLPDKVRTRTVKSDLSAFYRDITTQGDLDDVRRLLADPGCEVYRYVDRQRIQALAAQPPVTGRLADQRLVDGLHGCAIVECWLRRQVDPDSTERMLETVKPAACREHEAASAAVS